MTEGGGGRDPAAPKGAGSGKIVSAKKNAAALSAALRANLQRRKARERAARANAAPGDEPPAANDRESDSESKWTK
jgi:hypothetical protein